jgi:hypothetical protein
MKIKTYADVIAVATGGESLAYQEYGSSQGDYLAVTKAGDELHVWKGSYGSCSGCDWLENEREYRDDWNLTPEKAKELLGTDKPFLTLTIETAKEMLKTGTLESIFPANTRADIESNYYKDKVNFTDLIKEAIAPKEKQ